MYYFYNMDNQYYGFDDLNNRKNMQNNNWNEIIPLNEAIELIKRSVADEREDELFYTDLIKQAPSEKEKKIIENIRDDERKHNKILRQLFYEFTGQTLGEDNSIQQLNDYLNYRENLEKALFGELDAVAKYRKILGTMPSGDSYTLLMSIMTDELRHASKYNFLICINNK